MKKILILFVLFLLSLNSFAAEVYCEKNKFGLKDGQNYITEAKYSKMISLKDESYLFLYRGKYGIISKDGIILVEPKYTQAQRYVGRIVKLGRAGLYSLYDEKGNMLADLEYKSIDILYGRMFLIQKNYKYGLISFEGDIILAPIMDDIYMPAPNILKVLYDGNWYEIEQKNKGTIELPSTITEFSQNEHNFKITQIVQKPIASTGYGLVSFSDYFIKLFSSISPSYEQTIDELVLGHGADTASILIKSAWLVKFPFVYGKNYVNNIKAPNNGPLNDVKTNLKNKLNENDKI